MNIKDEPGTKPAVDADDGGRLPPPPPPKRVRLSADHAPHIEQTIVTVLVGRHPHQKGYSFQKSEIEKHSLFCKRIIEGWAAGTVGSVQLPGEKSEDFDRFYWFVHTGQLFITMSNDVILNNDGTHNDAELGRIQNAWLLGHKLCSPTFKDAVTDAMIEKLNDGGGSPLSLYKEIDRRGPRDSAFRRLLVDLAAFGWPLEQFERRRLPDMGQAFMHDVLYIMAARVRSSEQGYLPWKDPRCKYHEHAGEETCYKQMFGQ